MLHIVLRGLKNQNARAAKLLSPMLALAFVFGGKTYAQSTLPFVAVHDSELTRALENMNAVAPTPSGPGTTGKQWWPTDWHYFVMPESVKEAMKSDGTSFTVVGDSNVAAGVLMNNGQPRYPIVVSLASEAIDDSEIAAFTNYVASGGFLFVGSSAFSRNTNGTSRGDFAIANQLGLHLKAAGLTNWASNNTFTKTNQPAHRLVSDIPTGQLTWRMPSSSDEIPWGISPGHPFLAPHDVWQVNAAGATVLAQGDASPFLAVRQYGKGYFIYCSAFQPLIGHSGFAPSMYAYLILRRSIEWAFESANMPIPKLSPWPYQYDAAFMVRHDLENFTNEIAAIEASAQVEFTNGAKGDYYFCSGTLRDDASPTYNTNSVVASLRRAVTNYNATIGPHNGGLKNPNNSSLVRGQYDYWHWGPDEALDVTPPGYPSGKAYALTSISTSFKDVESWLKGITNGLRSWVGCYFNATREDSFDIQAQAGVNISGDEKLTPFPHWTISTQTPNKRYPFLSEPVSDWFVGGLVAQSLEPWHPPGVQNSQTMHAGVDFYYNLGALVNFYSHTLSTGLGDAGSLTPDYVSYCANTNVHPRMWAANGVLVYQWWLQRSNVQTSVTFSTNGVQSSMTFNISGAVNTNTAVEMYIPGTNQICGIQVFTNGVLAGTNIYRLNGQTFKLLVGNKVTNAVVNYYPLGSPAQVFSQNFDGITAPALPAGWSTSATGAESAWVTATSVRDTAPNAAFVPDPGNIGSSDLISPPITIPTGTAQLSFQNNYNFETGPGTDGFDGGVLEIKIGAAGFSDIVSAGGTFVSGGYNSTIDSGYSNPLAGRGAWSGNSGGFVSTVVLLPASASGQTIQLRWRAGTDDSNGSTGWRIDTISISSRSCSCCGGGQTNMPPVITGQPASLTNNAGTTATFNVTASGSSLTYQWIKNGAISLADGGNISGSLSSTLTISNVTDVDAATYAVVVSNPAGSVTSSVVSVTVIDPIVIQTQPVSSTNNAGTATTFTVSAQGTSPVYQWRKNGVNLTNGGNISGAASSALALSNLSATDAANYTVVITNLAGSVTSSVAILTVISPPVITTQPVSSTNAAGTTAAFSVAVAGQSPVYQWIKNGTNNLVDGGNITGSTSATLVISNVTDADASAYTVVITNTVGSVTSAVVSLNVIDPPVIQTQPLSRTNSPGTLATFTVTVAGTSPTYQWKKNGTNISNGGKISGATSSALSLSNVSATDGGNYTVVITNLAGSVTSSVATLTVISPPVITTQPLSSTNAAGTTASFTVAVAGPSPVYQWVKNGTNNLVDGGNIIGSTSPTLVISAVADADAAAYSVVITNAVGSVTSSVVTLTVIDPPVIQNQPVSRTNNAGTQATFTVTAQGTSLTYQWRKNGVNIANGSNVSGATTTALSLANVAASDAANYTVVIANSAGAVTSSIATLTVISPPAIIGQPISRTNVSGTVATFTVAATGTSPVYQWIKNGTNNLVDGGNITGSGSATLTISNVSSSIDAGNYSVLITNSLGSVTSSVVTLTVIDPPNITVQPASRTNNTGTTATFSVVATGTSPAYQWRKNGTNISNGGNISGATSSALSLSNLAVSDGGSYAVVITNLAGSVTSAPAVLTVVSTNPPGQLFGDDFTRGTDPGPITPWIAQSGTWTVTGGALRGGTNTLSSYAYAYITNVFTNFTVQGQVRFQTGGYGGGLGACVNRTSGAHYAAWIYPENSPGGSKLLKLVKFQTWTTWSYQGASYTPMAQVSLAAVGTNWHTLSLTCSNKQIAVSFDGTQMINVSDAEATTYLSGGISADMWTDTRGYQMWVDNVTVTSLTGVSGSLLSLPPIVVVTPPEIQSITFSNGYAIVTWTATSNNTYRLQYKSDLGDTDWTDVSGDVQAEEPTAVKSDKLGNAAQRFYRVMQVQ